MIAQHCGVCCSQRCEMVLALSMIVQPQHVVLLAHRLANDRNMSAVRLAQALDELPLEEAQLLSKATLERAGIFISAALSDPLEKLKHIIQAQ